MTNVLVKRTCNAQQAASGEHTAQTNQHLWYTLWRRAIGWRRGCVIGSSEDRQAHRQVASEKLYDLAGVHVHL